MLFIISKFNSQKVFIFFAMVFVCSQSSGLAQVSLFKEVTASVGVAVKGNNWGVAFGDFNNDSREDILVTRFGQGNLLYKNSGDGRFEEISQITGLDINQKNGMAVWGDIDNDGLLDLYLAGIEEPNRLFKNTGAESFTDISETAGVADSGKTEAVAFTDFNLDGHLDLFVFNRAAQNRFYQNKGQWVFEDVSNRTHTTGRSNAMGLAFTDYDNDGDQDLYLVYDGKMANNLYRNDGGVFTEVAQQAGVAVQAEGMAPAFGDFNNDGWLDLYITNMFENILFKNNGDGTFKNVTESAGVGDTGMGWGVSWLDFDNDGWLDLYVANASSFNTPPDPNVLYHNNGDGTFSMVNAQDPSSSLLSSFGAATADLNQDGYLDLFITNQGAENQLFQNLGGEHHWLAIKLIGTSSNRDALGAKVELRAGDLTLYREVTSACGWVSQNSLTLHFGLAHNTSVDEIEIKWPSRKIDYFYQIPADQKIIIQEHVGIITSVGAQRAITATSKVFSLSAVYPNPFTAENPAGQLGQTGVTIQFRVHDTTTNMTTLTIYNLLGQKVKTLLAAPQTAGQFSVKWNGKNDRKQLLSPGMYLVVLRRGAEMQSRKILLMK